MTPSPWSRLAMVGTILGLLLFLGDLAILGRYAVLLGRLARDGARIGPILGG